MLLVSSSGMGRNTARAMQLAKIVSRIMISKGLMESDQENIGQTWHKLPLENRGKDFHIQVCDGYEQVWHKLHLTIK